MTDFDYGLVKSAIRITSDRSERVWLWFWPQMTAIRDRMIAAAKQDMWEARRESREHVFCGERRGKQCDLTIDQLRTWKGWFGCNSDFRRPPPPSWHGPARAALSSSMTARSFLLPFPQKQRATDKIANEVRSCGGKRLFHPHQ